MKITTILIVALLLVAGCGSMTTWTLSGTDPDSPENDYVARLGFRSDSGVEIGAEINANMIGGHSRNHDYGGYILAELLETPAGVPYIGYRASVANEVDEYGNYGPIGGTIIKISENDEGTQTVGAIVEVQYLDPDREDSWKAFAGARFRF